MFHDKMRDSLIYVALYTLLEIQHGAGFIKYICDAPTTKLKKILHCIKTLLPTVDRHLLVIL